MATTTIAVSTQVRNSLNEFGFKGESYDAVIKRLLESVKERQLQELLMNESNTSTVSDALKRAKKQWQK